ncbi:hypothetical protein JCM3765_006213 [Sporobolomyces pararoseus]
MSSTTILLTSLPPELLSNIAFQLRRSSPFRPEGSLASLSLVCRKLRTAAQEEILRSVEVEGMEDFYRLQGSPFRGSGGQLQTLETAGKIYLVRNITLSPFDSYLEEIHNPETVERYSDYHKLPRKSYHHYPSLPHIVDFLVRFPNLNELSITCFPFLSLPSDQFSRLSQPLANITSLKVVTPPWDPDHQFLRQIVQLTPQLSTLTLERYFLPNVAKFKPCSEPLPYLPYLSHLTLEGQFYFSLPSLNLITPKQASKIRHLTLRSFSQHINNADLTGDYGEKFGAFFAEGVRHLEWRDKWVKFGVPEEDDQDELIGMLESLVKLRKITIDRLDTSNEWILCVPPSLEYLEVDCDADSVVLENILEIFIIQENHHEFLEGMRGKTLRLKSEESMRIFSYCDNLWARCGDFGWKVEFMAIGDGEIS